MPDESPVPTSTRVVVAGGGAAGFFAAIACAEAGGGPVVLLEKSPTLLAKVRISGGGRCNVTQACFDPAVLVTRFPRGGRELRGPLHRFQPRDTMAWFESRGVTLKTEFDGRVFPVTDRSETIIDCLIGAATAANVQVIRHAGVENSTRIIERFLVRITGGRSLECDKLIVATGGTRGTQGGPAIAASFGHTLVDPVPSLFTFHIDDARLRDLAGLSVDNARVRVSEAKLEEIGPVLITHWGLSGPAILRLSAWGARWMYAQNYEFTLRVNWCSESGRDAIQMQLQASKETNAKRLVCGDAQFNIPVRLWERLSSAAGVSGETRWAHLKREQMLALADQLTASEFAVRGKSMNKEEFVTAGGVTLREVDFRTMESRRCAGLYFAGEVLNIDGITGGYNFQSAWTTGWIAGRAAASAEQ